MLSVFQPLQDKRAPAGQKVVLECQVSGQPLPAVKWTKEGVNAGDFPEYSVLILFLNPIVVSDGD